MVEGVFAMGTTVLEAMEPEPRIPLATEILSYLGGIFAVVAAFVLLTVFWNSLGVVGHLGISGAVAIAGLAGGVFLGGIEDRAARRLQQFLLLVGVGACGATAGIAYWHVAMQLTAGMPIFSREQSGLQSWAIFAGSATAAVVGGIVYRVYRLVGTQIVFGFSVAMVAFTSVVVAYAPADPTPWAVACALLAAGLLWGAAALLHRMPSGETTALAISGAMLVVGLLMLASYSFELESQGDATHWPMYAALCGAVVLLVVGIVLKRLVIVGFGAAGTVVLVPMLLSEVFSSSIVVPISTLMLGVVLMAVAAVFAWPPVQKVETLTGPSAPGSVPTAAEPALPLNPVRGIPVLSEVLGYVGGAFALGSGIALIFVYADTIGMYGQIGVCAIASAVGLAGGLSIGRVGDKAARRLEQFLLAVGATGAGAAVGLGAYRVVASGALHATGTLAAVNASDWGWFLGSLVAALVGGAVWWFRRTWMQEIVFGVAVAMTCVTALLIPQTQGPDWVVGAVLATVGVIWGALGLTGAIKPVNAALALGALGVEGGILAMAVMGISGEQSPYAWALWLGVGVSASFIIAGALLKRWVVVGIGALGLWQFTQTVIQVVFPDSPIGPILILGAGVVLIGGGIAWAVISQRRGGHHHLAT